MLEIELVSKFDSGDLLSLLGLDKVPADTAEDVSPSEIARELRAIRDPDSAGDSLDSTFDAFESSTRFESMQLLPFRRQGLHLGK